MNVGEYSNRKNRMDQEFMIMNDKIKGNKDERDEN